MRLGAILLVAATALAERAVDRDGRVFTGEAEIHTPEQRIVFGRRELPFAELYLVERDDGTLLFAPDAHARLRGYEYLALQHMRKSYARLVRNATYASDFKLAYEYLARAEAAGLAGKDAITLKRRIEAALRKGKGKGKSTSSKKLHAAAADLEAYFGELLVARAERALDGGTDGAWLLREALRRTPKAEKGAAVLARIAPKSFAMGDARVWLDWHLDLETSGATMAPDALVLKRAKKKWRKELHAIRTGPILLVTPVTDSYTIGRCLAYGRLTCRALDELFKTDKPFDKPIRPLSVFLFPNKDEYLTHSGTGRPVHNAALIAWSAGYYSPRDGISRFYWFKDPGAERRIVGTCVHELTHHWLAERNPRTQPGHPHGTEPGFWIVEGFASLLQEGVFDVESDHWDLFNPRARSLDVMQSVAGTDKLLPWGTYYALTQLGFLRVPRDNKFKVVLRWWLQPYAVSTARMFYVQGTATCQFLYHAEGGKDRDKLIDYVVNYYDGYRAMLTPKAAFGMSGSELGKRTEQFAKAVAGGWTPTK